MAEISTGSSALEEFKLKYRFQIKGRSDILLQDVGSLITDDRAYNIFKVKRARMLETIRGISDNALLDPAVKAKKLAEVKIASLYEAFKAVKTADPEGKYPKKMASATAYIARELKTAVTEYVSAHGDLPADTDTSALAADDDQFLETVGKIQRGLAGIATKLKIALRADHVFFNAKLNSAKKALDAIEEAVNDFAPSSGSLVDVLV